MISLGALLLAAGMAPVHAQQERPAFRPIATPVDPMAIPLSPLTKGKVAASSSETWVESNGQRIVRNVTRPTLTPVLPAAGKGTGAAVIIAPGGGFMILSIDNEGFAVARWLADHGIAAFVLKYRTEATAADPVAFGAQFGARMAALAHNAGPRIAQPAEGPAKDDGLAALRLVRRQASQWNIDPRRIGFMGFSAGAATALNVALAQDPTASPDFIAPIYPSVDARAIPTDVPPMFLAIASDDQVYGGKGYGLVEAWQRAHSPVELHVYEKGGHGFGFAPRGTTSDHWLAEFYWWLEARGMLKVDE